MIFIKHYDKQKDKTYKDKYTFEERLKESTMVCNKCKDKIPIICERFNTHIPLIKKTKYLVSRELTIGYLVYIIKKQLNISTEKSIYLMTDGYIACNSMLVGVLYDNKHDKDGFLYINYCLENVFG